MRAGAAIVLQRSLSLNINPFKPQSRCGDKTVKFQVVCPKNGTAVLKGLDGKNGNLPLLRGTILNRTYGRLKTLYISVFLLTIFGHRYIFGKYSGPDIFRKRFTCYSVWANQPSRSGKIERALTKTIAALLCELNSLHANRFPLRGSGGFSGQVRSGQVGSRSV